MNVFRKLRTFFSRPVDRRRPFFHSAAVYGFEGRVFIHPYARTRDGVSTQMEDIAVVPADDAREIGVQLLAMLERCIDNVPDNYDRKQSPALAVTLRAAKMRSWRSFHNKAMLVGVFREIGAPEIELTPSRHAGGGSEHLTEKAIISGPEPEELGRNVIAALALCA